MKKIVKIGSKEYTMQSSAYTSFAYKNETGRKLLDDIQHITKLKETNDGISALDDISEIVLRIAFIMAEEGDKNQVSDYVSFLKGIDNLYDNLDWLNDVIELAAFPISGGSVQKDKN